MTKVHDKNRYYQAVQWIQALVVFGILAIIYASHQWLSSSSAQWKDIPKNPSAQNIVQKSYWNDEIGYGFSAEKDDIFHHEIIKNIPIEVDTVGIDTKEGTIFEDARVRVSFYPTLSIEEIEKRHPVDKPRSYSRLSKGIAVIEGDLESHSAKTILATLHSR